MDQDRLFAGVFGFGSAVILPKRGTAGEAIGGRPWGGSNELDGALRLVQGTDGRLVGGEIGDGSRVVVIGDGQKHGQARGPVPT
jgi:hypothetical protein